MRSYTVLKCLVKYNVSIQIRGMIKQDTLKHVYA